MNEHPGWMQRRRVGVGRPGKKEQSLLGVRLDSKADEEEGALGDAR